MQNPHPITNVSSQHDAPIGSDAPPADVPERRATIWVSRMTSIIGLLCLAAALAVWAGRPGHFRLVLALLTVAMFAAILHSYTFENGG